MTKQRLRQTITAIRKIIPYRDRVRAEEYIIEEVRKLPEWERARMVCLYMSEPEEVDTKSLLADLLNDHKTVVLPRIGRDGLTLHTISSIKDLVPGPFGIVEPKKSSKKIATGEVELFIVPGIAFDTKGYRIGWGKGHYDKLLASVTVPKVGLAYAIQMVAEVPHARYDIPMTHIITERGTHICHP